MLTKREKQTLRRAKALIKKGWCKGSFARDKNGMGVPFNSPQAVKFCMLGAVYRAAGSSSNNLATDLYHILCKVMPNTVSYFNDKFGRKKSQILAKFDQAINYKR
jgi:hypothetical protein